MHSGRRLSVLYVIADMLLIPIVWLVAFYVRFYTFFSAPKGIPSLTLYLQLIPFIFCIWFFVFSFSGFFRRIGRHKSTLIESFDIIQLSLISHVLFISTAFFYDEYRYSRGVLVIFALLQPIVLIAVHGSIRKVLRHYREHLPCKKIIMLGYEKHYEKTLSVSRGSFFSSNKIVGVFLEGSPDIARSKEFFSKEGVAVFENSGQWVDFFISHPCDLFIFNVGQNSSFLSLNFNDISEQVSSIKIVPDLDYLRAYSEDISLQEQHTIYEVHSSPLQGHNLLLKRVMDVCGALLALFLFSPLILLIIFLLKKGKTPVIFKQKRMGLDGRLFNILKFTSMVPESDGPRWTQKNDFRTTRLGAILRRTSLDELPQLINVLRGEMSLIGPRPERPIFVDEFRKRVPGYMVRHKVKAGMTGWAQVNGWRGDTSIERRIEHDLFYIQRWTFMLDVKIMILTIFRGFTHPNAY